jgi:hypothetical protein
MPNSPFVVCGWNALDHGRSINVSMEPFRAFVGDNLPKNNVPWDGLHKVFYRDRASHQTLLLYLLRSFKVSLP